MKLFLKGLSLFLTGYLIFMLIAFPESSMQGAKSALLLASDAVIPSLFPFFVVSHLLTGMGVPQWMSKHLSQCMIPLFGISGSGALAVVLGVISGYPVGAETVKNLYISGACTKDEAEKLLMFCNNAGPLFVVGTLGVGIFHSRQLGFLLYGIHLVSALMTGWMFRRYGRRGAGSALLPPSVPERCTPAILGEAVERGVTSVLKVCGFVVFFGVVGAVLPQTPIRPFLYGITEITGGIRSLAESGVCGRWLLPMVSMLLAFSGVSILFQTAGILHPSGLSLRPYLLGKVCQGILAFTLTWLALAFFPQVVPTASMMQISQEYSVRGISVAVALMGLWIAIKKASLVNSRDAEYRRLPKKQSPQGLPWGHPKKNPNKTPEWESPQTHGGTGEPFLRHDS